MGTPWFKLSGKFEGFKWVGDDLTLTSKTPVSATVRVSAARVTGPREKPVVAANGESIYQTEVSEGFLHEFEKAIAEAPSGTIFSTISPQSRQTFKPS